MSIQENNQDEDLMKGLAASTAQSTSKEEDALDLGISDSLGKLANRSNAFNKQRLEDFDAIKIGLASPEMIRY